MTDRTILSEGYEKDLELRPLQVHELESAYGLELSCYPSEAAATLEAFSFRQKHFSDYFWSAWSANRLVGLACGVRTVESVLEEDAVKHAHSAQAEGMHLCVLSVAVDREARRIGLGSALVDKLLQQAKKDKLKTVFLMCEAHLIDFYRKHGFNYIGISPSQHGGIEWHEMRLIL
ncbi:acetyltransferase [Paenibacillus baekrokdamisoli]|uniref:Acetyltransferase n=1 Tax=Paenibacillus baekrokdamisoli TaxID=1712516 RepID=A0A3G9JAA6_9BACL|nr:GNAT family N-acetyltransferase [Paenibacillus baekrokdamisoli]MBB3070579.1 ribosomal protein S18 acetylase RimI-like enzyme [Paenibacillus baekrokdamisoli]BBH19929.1 acetyltransferase [Paenibacillus baekrokdamisoli]